MTILFNVVWVAVEVRRYNPFATTNALVAGNLNP